MAFLERQYGVKTYIYDICPTEDCAAVFRGEFRLHTKCPRCDADRLDKNGKALKKLYYLSISDWIQKMLKDPDMARYLFGVTVHHLKARWHSDVQFGCNL
jgi:hypothetical protein